MALPMDLQDRLKRKKQMKVTTEELAKIIKEEISGVQNSRSAIAANQKSTRNDDMSFGEFLDQVLGDDIERRMNLINHHNIDTYDYYLSNTPPSELQLDVDRAPPLAGTEDDTPPEHQTPPLEESFPTDLSRGLAKQGIARLSPKESGPLQQLGVQLAAQIKDLPEEEKQRIIDMIAALAGITGLQGADPATAPTRDPSLEESYWAEYRGRGKKSYAHRVDGGANDEGFHHKYCPSCGKRTEHEMGHCISCVDKRGAKTQKTRERNQPLLDAIAEAGPNSFLQKMEAQINQGRDLTEPQRIVVMKILRGNGVDTSGLV
jgi:hypothetical protein